MDLTSTFAAITALVLSGGVGWLALNTIRAGFDYASARGNPRNRAGAHETLWDVGKGALLIFGGTLLAAAIFAAIKLGPAAS